jgi:hypothetical protein
MTAPGNANAEELSRRSRLEQERLARVIVDYWADQGYSICATVSRGRFIQSARHTPYVLTTDMLNGLPRGFKGRPKPIAKREDPLMAICEATAKEYRVSVEDIRGRSQTAYISSARGAFCASAATYGYGHSEIGRFLDRDHSTIGSAIKSHHARQQELAA